MTILGRIERSRVTTVKERWSERKNNERYDHEELRRISKYERSST